MTSKNDITGDNIKSKTNNDLYRNGWDRIFGKENNKPKVLGDYIAEVMRQENIKDRSKPE